jgi:tRNA A-37 threonylcarbamoyl transferase component Bud32
MVGETFGNYEVVATLGKGGVGVVYLAQHQTIARRAAIKVIATELSKDRDVVKRFFLEALATSLIRHPGIVEVYDYGVESNGRAYIVMEYLEGETLAACLERTITLSWQTACAIAQRIASAVGAAHRHGIVHRDLKPGNVFVSRVAGSSAATERQIKVLDFGLAKLLSDDRNLEPITRAGMFLGTPMYISPEQCSAAGEVTPSTDIYSLGCILFEMICGKPPFERDGIRAILGAHMFEAPPRLSERVAGVPAWLDDLVARMLAKKPDERPASMAEVAEELASAGHEDAGLTWLMPGSATATLPATLLPTAAPPQRWHHRLRVPVLRVPRLSRVARQLRLSVIDRRVRRVAGLAIGLVALVVIGAVAFSRDGRAPPRAPAPASMRVAAAQSPAKIADPGLRTAVTPALSVEPLAPPPPTTAVEVPEAPASLQVVPVEVPAPVKRRIGEAPARRRPESPHVRAPAETDGIVDL